MLQAEVAAPRTVIDLVLQSGPETLVVLAVTGVLSLASWFIIGLKWWQFRRLRAQSARFHAETSRGDRLRETYRAVMKQPPSPYGRVFREGVTFYSDLHPGALAEGASGRYTLSDSQLEALKLVLAKEIAVERDLVSRGVPWLATIGAVGPLLGLLGTVLGVMDAFIGIAASGSGNLSAVAPGVAEALVTTVAGLSVAIPSVMAYNYFAGRVGTFEGELEGFGNALIGWMAREGLI